MLQAIETLDGPLAIHSDSTYVVNCFNDRWYEGWLARGWKNSQKKPVANRDLWEPLIDLVLERDEITFTWVKGHSGNEMNEIADQLAVAEVERLRAETAEASGAARTNGAGETNGVAIGQEPPWPIERAIVVTGGRDVDEDQLAALEEAIATLDADNDVIVSGLRLGAELLGAELAERAGVPVAVVLPYPDPVRVWSAQDRARFDAAVDGSAWLVTLDGDPAKPGPAIRNRNEWLWVSTVGAIIVGDEELCEEAEMAGLGVISV